MHEVYGDFSDPNSKLSKSNFIFVRHGISDFNHYSLGL